MLTSSLLGKRAGHRVQAYITQTILIHPEINNLYKDTSNELKAGNPKFPRRPICLGDFFRRLTWPSDLATRKQCGAVKNFTKVKRTVERTVKKMHAHLPTRTQCASKQNNSHSRPELQRVLAGEQKTTAVRFLTNSLRTVFTKKFTRTR